MTMSKRSTVVGVFESHTQADKAVDELRRVGFRNDQIGVVAPHPNRSEYKETDKGSKWEEGAVTGALAGAGVGGLVGLGIMAGVIPVFGPVIAGGTLAVILANAAGGAAIAGLVGSLIGSGIPEEEARWYESEFKSGRTIVTVKADGRYDEAAAILRRHGAYDRGSVTAGAACSTGTTHYATSGMAAQGSGAKSKQLREEPHN